MAKLTNAERQAAYRARKKAAKEQTPGGIAPNAGETVMPSGGDDEGVTVEVNAPTTPTPQLSLKDRFMKRLQGNTPASKPKPRGKGKQADTNLLTTVLPTVIASLIAVYAQDLLPEDYKPCAPTKEEISGVLGPLFDILGRRVEVIGKASQDAIDLMNSLICAFMYGTRAYITYVDIKKTKEYPAYVQQKQEDYRAKLEREAREYEAVTNGQPSTNLADGLRAYQTTANGHLGNGYSGVTSTAYEPTTQNDVERFNVDAENGDTEGRSKEAALVANLFSRDRQGRVRLGLLPA